MLKDSLKLPNKQLNTLIILFLHGFLYAGESAGGDRDRESSEPAGARGLHREVGRHRRHLSLHAQLQRRPADLCRLRQQLCVPAEENLGKTVQAGLFWIPD